MTIEACRARISPDRDANDASTREAFSGRWSIMQYPVAQACRPYRVEYNVTNSPVHATRQACARGNVFFRLLRWVPPSRACVSALLRAAPSPTFFAVYSPPPSPCLPRAPSLRPPVLLAFFFYSRRYVKRWGRPRFRYPTFSLCFLSFSLALC